MSKTQRGKSTPDDLSSAYITVAESINTTSMQIKASDGIPLMTVHPDGRWVVDPERAPEAAKVFLDEVANYTERLREAERCVADVRKVLFEDASLSHDDRLSKAAALLYAPQSQRPQEPPGPVAAWRPSHE